MTRVTLSPAQLAQIYAHARAAFPAECCGYVAGDAVVECTNAIDTTDVLVDRSADRGFVIAGRELFDFAKSFDSPNPARVVYHSHTNGRAYFSSTDREMAVGGDAPAYPVQHLVVGVTADGITEAAQFAWDGDANDFVEVARWVP